MVDFSKIDVDEIGNKELDYSNINTFDLGNNNAGTAGFVGYMAEAILFKKTLTAAEITNIENYLSNKWSL